MADITIGNLPALNGSTLLNDSVLPVEQDGVTYQISVANLAAKIGGGGNNGGSGITAESPLSIVGGILSIAPASSSSPGSLSASGFQKLQGIAVGATANSSDAQLRDRSTHTGTQPANTISGLGTAALVDSSSFATASQGALATTALQPNTIGTSVQAFSARLSEIVAGFTGASNGQSIRKNAGGTLEYYTPSSGTGGGIALTDLSANAPLAYNSTNGQFSIPAATTSSPGHMSAADKTAIANLANTYQPLDTDLSAIATLITTTFGRSLLTQVDAAATRTTIGAVGLSQAAGLAIALS